MKVKEIAEKYAYQVVSGDASLDAEVDCVYCCDLLSFVMGRAPADSAWVTVMGNVNSAAVASLAGVACIVIADGVQPDDAMIAKANQQDIAVLLSPDPIFTTAKNIDNCLQPK